MVDAVKKARRPAEAPTPAEPRVEDDPLAEARELFVAQVGGDLNDLWANLTRAGAMLVALMTFEDRPLSIDEAAQHLRISRTHVFNGLRHLMQLGIATRVRATGTKRDLYQLAGRYPDIILSAAVRRLRQSLAVKVAPMEKCRAVLSRVEGPEAAEKAARVGRLLVQYQLGAQLLDMIVGPEPNLDLEKLLGERLPEVTARLAGLLVPAPGKR